MVTVYVFIMMAEKINAEILFYSKELILIEAAKKE